MPPPDWRGRSPASAQGDFSFPALLAGEYEVSVEAPGFQRMVRQAVVEAGTTTTADFTLRVGDVKDSVTVDGASPQMHYDSHTVGGVVTHSEIEDLPLNGRSFLELAKLEPGVQAPTRSVDGRTFVPVLGAPGGNSGRGTRVTIDGGSIMAPGYAGSKMGFSQEAVQEFQISTVNFDLSTGITLSGAINVVTRSGGNDLPRDSVLLLPGPQPGRLSRAQSRSGKSRSILPAAAVRFRARRSHPPRPRIFLCQLGAQRATRSREHDAGGGFCSPQRHHAQPGVRRSGERAAGCATLQRAHRIPPLLA